jgi:hypothetical protein
MTTQLQHHRSEDPTSEHLPLTLSRRHNSTPAEYSQIGLHNLNPRLADLLPAIHE